MVRCSTAAGRKEPAAVTVRSYALHRSLLERRKCPEHLPGWHCRLVVVVRPFMPGSSGEPIRLLWQIGIPDNKTAEFALGPKDYAKFNDDPLFVVGVSEAKRDWPYVQPGPADAWAGARRQPSRSFRVKRSRRPPVACGSILPTRRPSRPRTTDSRQRSSAARRRCLRRRRRLDQRRSVAGPQASSGR